jgi:hypothetical protein
MPNGEDRRGEIPAPILPPAREILKFSFRHLDTYTEKFTVSHCDGEFLRQLLHTIRELSSWTVEQFCDQNNNERRHVIWFPDTTEPDGFPNLDKEQLSYHESWQFQLSKEQEWRVHGILIDDTYYIVWLDPNHALYGPAAPKPER